ncbi:MAG TPA: 30S ribosomal protein S12 methylthiotransferase RimO [Saprospiraceae bacterium]|nr:30S ribosomal protein S12 methylthiotransferase RimO [Saprospiraceae bacterium]
MKTKTYRKEKVQLVTLGCSKNLVDSENLMMQLDHNNYHVEHNPMDEHLAEIIIVNTCGFIDRAKEESIDTILNYASLKNEGKIQKLYVTGCLSQRYKDHLEEEIPEVDAYFGTMEMPALLNKLNADYKSELIGERILSTPSHYAYLKISEGCNRTCSFCAIPLMRGKHQSVPIEQLVIQAKSLAKQGVRELILIAQELTYYGLDLYKKRMLAELLEELCKVDGIEWIRLHYAYPSKFPTEILPVMREQAKICKYLDLPLQHISDSVLLGMKRQITKKETIELIELIRKEVPDIALRTTMLIGFPGETEEHFEELCEFIKEYQFDRLGVFQYSHEEDTSAFAINDDVPQELKEERARRLMEIQEQISHAKNEKKVGQTMRVLVDRKENGYFVGRTEYDSPEVDNEVLISDQNTYCRIGDFVEVRIMDYSEFDLFAEPI